MMAHTILVNMQQAKATHCGGAGSWAGGGARGSGGGHDDAALAALPAPAPATGIRAASLAGVLAHGVLLAIDGDGGLSCCRDAHKSCNQHGRSGLESCLLHCSCQRRRGCQPVGYAMT